jgi:hypothetical protein
VQSIPFVPLDDRPCCRDFPLLLAPLAGMELRLPEDALLGWCTRPGDTEALIDWLTPGPALLSVDMLLYGGLVASRSLDLDAAAVEARADRLQSILSPQAQVFSIIMRVPPYCRSDEERRFSEDLVAWSQLLTRVSLGFGGKLKLRALERRIPTEYIQRYMQARTRNYTVNRRVLDWARDGQVAYALLGMDDSKTSGLNVRERDALLQSMPSDADLIPGADELAMLLLARLALSQSTRRPTVDVRYSPDSLRGRVTRYEDRAVQALVEAHCRVLGLHITSEKDADIVFYVYGPSRAQQEAAIQILPAMPSSRLRAMAREAGALVTAGRTVGIADLGYASGADRALVAALAESVELPSLASYAAWNTAGNTVGTSLSHAALRWLSVHAPLPGTDAVKAAEAHARFLFERFVDDYLYEAGIRQELSARATMRGLNLYALGDQHDAVNKEMQSRLLPAATAFHEKHFRGRSVRTSNGSITLKAPEAINVSLPWPRLFEVRVQA